MRTLQCGFAAPCGRTEIVTLYHPLHDVSEAGGRFRIEGVPVGEEVKVSAWHPLFIEAEQRVTLSRGESLQVELTVRPAPATPVPEPPSEDDDVLF